MANIKRYLIVLVIILTCIINLIVNIYRYEYKYINDNKNTKYTVMVLEKQKESKDKIVYLVKINNDKFLLNIYFKSKYDKKDEVSNYNIRQIKSYKYGDGLEVSGKIIIPENLGNCGEFNYKKYLNSKSIVAYINTYDVNYVDNIGNKFWKVMYKLKEKIASKIDNNLNSKEGELLKGMLYGDTKNLDEDIKDIFERIGISHITTVSGSNLSVFLIVVGFLVSKVNINKYVYFVIQLILIIIFCIISNLELSVLRASIMMIIYLITKFINRKITIEKSLIISLFCIITVNPYRIFNIGMILSFLAVISIAIFYPKIYNFFESKIKWKIKRKVVQKILIGFSSIISLTLAANILIFPITINTFNNFSFGFIISNMFVSMLCSVINIIGLVLVIIPKTPIVGNICWDILSLCLKVLIKLSILLDGINLSIKIRDIPMVIIVCYYIYMIVIYINNKIQRKHIKEKVKVVQRRILCSFVVITCSWTIYLKIFNNYIYYFNVGQGEMAIIKKNDTVIMVDSGSITNDTKYIFDAFSNKENISKIDILVISHFHSDHMNGIYEILEDYVVSYVVYSQPYDLQNEEYLNFLDCINRLKIKQIIVKAGDKIKINNLHINVIFPNIEYISLKNKIDEKENANSLCINIQSSNKNYLFLGDSVKESEEHIKYNLNNMNLSEFQNVKIAHHGSKTSTTENLISFLKPSNAIISAKKEVYNHPSKEVLNILDKYRIKTYITEKIGGIKFLGI